MAASGRRIVAVVTFPGPGGTVLIGDGGMASTLEARGHRLSDQLWSARLLLEIDVGELPAVLVGSSTERDGIKWELNST